MSAALDPYAVGSLRRNRQHRMGIDQHLGSSGPDSEGWPSGRALPSHGRGHRFNPCRAHHKSPVKSRFLDGALPFPHRSDVNGQRISPKNWGKIRGKRSCSVHVRRTPGIGAQRARQALAPTASFAIATTSTPAPAVALSRLESPRATSASVPSAELNRPVRTRPPAIHLLQGIRR
jgi:hypothetical protein